RRSGVTSPHMRPVATVVAFGAGPRRAARALDATALAVEIVEDFPTIKRTVAGSLAIVLIDDAGDADFAAACKAAGILKHRGGGEAIVVPPALEADPGPRAIERLQRTAGLTRACVMQPVRASWTDAVRCLVEPL